MLIKRRLGILKESIRESTVKLVKSGANRGDELTRVRKRWLEQKGLNAVATAMEEVRAMHEQHHMGLSGCGIWQKRWGKELIKTW